MPTRLIFVRHGETPLNAANQLIGWQRDPSLNKQGRAHATSVGERLRQYKPDAIYHSDLLRTTETATIIADKLGLTPTPTRLLRERDLGDFDGHTLAEIKLKWPEETARFLDHSDTTWAGHNGESLATVHARYLSLTAELEESHYSTILLVTHSGFIHTTLRDHYHFFPTESFADVAHDSITIVDRTDAGYTLTLYNETTDGQSHR